MSALAASQFVSGTGGGVTTGGLVFTRLTLSTLDVLVKRDTKPSRPLKLILHQLLFVCKLVNEENGSLQYHY